jgi:hypothetical protein
MIAHLGRPTARSLAGHPGSRGGSPALVPAGAGPVRLASRRSRRYVVCIEHCLPKRAAVLCSLWLTAGHGGCDGPRPQTRAAEETARGAKGCGTPAATQSPFNHAQQTPRITRWRGWQAGSWRAGCAATCSRRPEGRLLAAAVKQGAGRHQANWLRPASANSSGNCCPALERSEASRCLISKGALRNQSKTMNSQA